MSEFFTDAVEENKAYGDILGPYLIEAHGAILLKIQEDENAPSVVCINVHFSFGGELTRLEVLNKKLIFETDYLFDTLVRYEIRLPQGLYCGKLPQYCGYFNGRLEIYLPHSGHYEILVPLKER